MIINPKKGMRVHIKKNQWCDEGEGVIIRVDPPTMDVMVRADDDIIKSEGWWLSVGLLTEIKMPDIQIGDIVEKGVGIARVVWLSKKKSQAGVAYLHELGEETFIIPLEDLKLVCRKGKLLKLTLLLNFTQQIEERNIELLQLREDNVRRKASKESKSNKLTDKEKKLCEVLKRLSPEQFKELLNKD